MNSTETIERIKKQIANNDVLLYMKGTPDFPRCGFSAQVVQILSELQTNYGYVNVLDNPDIRATLPQYAKWPTFPQLYIKGELIGGCDIVTELHQKADLKPKLESAKALSAEHAQVSEAAE